MRKVIACFATGLLLAGCAAERVNYDFASAPPDAPEAQIDFVQYRGVYSWQAPNDQLLYVQARDRDWYEVKLLAPCIGLPYAQGVRFLPSDSAGHFDRFSSIRIPGQTCKVLSVKAVPTPERHVAPYAAMRSGRY